MLATSKNVLFPAQNHPLNTLVIKVLGHQYQWLAGGYDLEIGLFRGGYHDGHPVDSGFLPSV